jgi:G:T-mismatch repair DNA endonuclease (very short patch repair protein)
MEKKFIKRIGTRSQKWTIKVQNNIRKASELLTRLLAKGWKLLEDITFKKGFYSFRVEWI